MSRAACWLAIDGCTEIVHRASEGRVVLVLLAKYPLDRLGTILGATFCERFDQTGRAVLHRLRGYRRSAELLTLARRNLSRVGAVLRAARRLAAVPAAAVRDKDRSSGGPWFLGTLTAALEIGIDRGSLLREPGVNQKIAWFR